MTASASSSTTSSRPPLHRGHSMPVYFSSKDDPVDSTLSSTLASLNLADHPKASSSSYAAPRSRPSLPSLPPRSPEMFTRTPVGSPAASSPYHSPHPDTLASHPTPPYSSSSTTPSRTYHQSSYFPPHASYTTMMMASGSRSNASRSSSASISPGPVTSTNTSVTGQPLASTSSRIPYDMSPLVKTSLPGILRIKSGKCSSGVNMSLESTTSHYILVAPLGLGYSADGITIAARKENVLMIIADRWDEEDSHYEWQVQFGRDGDMSGIHATFENGLLKITVKRLYMHLHQP